MAKDVQQFIKNIQMPEGGSIAWSGPAASGNSIVFGACDKHLYCINRMTGRLEWKFLTGGAVTSPANIVNGRIYFTSCDKHLYCLSMKGDLVWKTLFPEIPWGGETFHDGIIYTGCNDNNLYALSADDGRVMWVFRSGGIVSSSIAVVNDSIYFGSFDKYLRCIDLEGRLKWKFMTQGCIDWSLGIADETGRQIWSVMDRNSNRHASEGTIYVGSYDNCMYAVSLDGEMRWKFLTGNIILSPASISGGNVYFGSWDRNFYCIDARSGSMKWRFVTGGFMDAPAYIHNNTAYFGSYDQNLYALNLDGRKAWSFTTGGFVTCPPLVHDGILYFGSCDTYMYAIRLSDKKLLWKFQTGMPAASFEALLKEFSDIVQAEKKPFSFSDWKPETMKKSYSWNIEAGNLVTSPYKSDNPYMNKPVYTLKNPYERAQKRKEPWER